MARIFISFHQDTQFRWNFGDPEGAPGTRGAARLLAPREEPSKGPGQSVGNTAKHLPRAPDPRLVVGRAKALDCLLRYAYRFEAERLTHVSSNGSVIMFHLLLGDSPVVRDIRGHLSCRRHFNEPVVTRRSPAAPIQGA